jgi:outer membrane protein assembly factor BamB
MRSIFLLLLPAFLFLLVFDSHAQNISQWRGINRDGIYPDQNLLKVWPEAGPKLLWLTEAIGNGYSSPVIANGVLYVRHGNALMAYGIK